MKIQIKSGAEKPIIVTVTDAPSRSKRYISRTAKRLAALEGIAYLFANPQGWTIYVLPGTTRSGKRHDIYGAIRAVLQDAR